MWATRGCSETSGIYRTRPQFPKAGSQEEDVANRMSVHETVPLVDMTVKVPYTTLVANTQARDVWVSN